MNQEERERKREKNITERRRVRKIKNEEARGARAPFRRNEAPITNGSPSKRAQNLEGFS